MIVMPDSNKDWSDIDLSDLKQCAKSGITLDGAAVLLGRDLIDVAKKAEELGLRLPPASREILRK